tara:strand:+ start:127 stop:342 length:216 start_codon:yes stop_codon:yes gene_type:complete
MSIKLTLDQWNDFTGKYGAEMYKDKLTSKTRISDEDPNYIEIIFGQGCNHTGYDLVEEYLTNINQQNKGET